jgi:hypothetical protein
MKKLIIITLLYSLNLFSQYKLEGNAGISYPVYTSDYESPLYEYWKFGLNLGINGNIKLIDDINVIPFIRYQYLFFNKYIQYGRNGKTAINSSGNGANVLKLGAEINIWDNKNIIFRPYIILGGGYSIEKHGTMTIKWHNEMEEIYSTETKYPDRNYWYFGGGIGVRLNISSDFNIRSSFKTYAHKSEYYGWYASYWMLDCNIFYTIIK